MFEIIYINDMVYINHAHSMLKLFLAFFNRNVVSVIACESKDNFF